jgi:ABC-type amino acid transport substrate-binding protein
MAKIVKLATYIFNPYQFPNSDNKIVGMDYDIVKKSFEIAGYDVDLLVCDNQKVIDTIVETGEVDGAFQFQETLERLERFIFSNLYRRSELEAIAIRDKFVIANYGEIVSKGLMIGLHKDYSYENCIDVIPEELKIYYENFDMMLKDLNDGKLDLCVVEKRVKDYLVKKLELNNVYTLEKLRLTRLFCTMFNKSKSIIRDDFNLGLKKLIETNQYFEIIKYWETNQHISGII